MIKSLLESAEDQPEKIRTEPEEKMADDLAVDESFESFFAGVELTPPETNEPEEFLETPEPADDALILSENPNEAIAADTAVEKFDSSEPHFNQSENSFAKPAEYESLAKTAAEPANDELLAGFPKDKINYELPPETAIDKPDSEPAAEISNETAHPELLAETTGGKINYESPAEAKPAKPSYENSGLLFQSPAKPESFAETARQSGMAYAAAITLFGSIVFMLIIGWFADLLLGSSPWGIVGGILLGAAIGFFQFFRLTSQIFKDRD